MDIQLLMKKAQEMQTKVKKAQTELEAMIFTGTSAGNLVKIEMNGNRDVLSVKIDPSMMNEEVSMLEDLILTAFNSATEKAREKSKEMMDEATGNLPLPPGF